jgi:hypothetical protein
MCCLVQAGWVRKRPNTYLGVSALLGSLAYSTDVCELNGCVWRVEWLGGEQGKWMKNKWSVWLNCSRKSCSALRSSHEDWRRGPRAQGPGLLLRGREHIQQLWQAVVTTGSFLPAGLGEQIKHTWLLCVAFSDVFSHLLSFTLGGRRCAEHFLIYCFIGFFSFGEVQET